MSSHWFLPSIAARWISLNLDLDICHLAFPFRLVSSVTSKPVSQCSLHSLACRHVYSSQEDMTKGTPACVHTLLSCEVGSLQRPPHQPLSWNLDPPTWDTPLPPASHLVWAFPSYQTFPSRRHPRLSLALGEREGKREFWHPDFSTKDSMTQGEGPVISLFLTWMPPIGGISP